MGYKDTKLWKNSIANNKYEHDDLRANLISEFERTRENARYILEKIRNDFPNLTVHDITHVDGLWQVASVIVGADYAINPLEAYVLGCAFLMHDAVLSYDAAGGITHLRSLKEWKDYYVDYQKDDSLDENEKLYETDFRTIRLLHAQKAEKIYNQLFDKADGSRFYVIENETLRNHYGEIICQIAGSHHWNIEDVGKLDTQIPANSEYPREWDINPLKLACILRCADAGHIDDGRAPDYLLGLLKVNGVSRNHWIAQNKLSQIDVDKNDPEKVIIKSNISFKEEDFSAWNVACDAVRVLDHELKASNELLKRRRITQFKTKGVSGANSREELRKYIKTEGWEPYDAEIHISNVEDLIRNLGGEKLYGKDQKLEIVLRELIQNSRDAIVARCFVDPGYHRGEIHIEIEDTTDGIWISVIDDGVGMPISTIKDYFLNFGCSFWASDLSKREFSGLNSSGFKSVGQFGIGFYAIFMVAAKVIVESRKYDSGLDDNVVLKFPTGLSLRPIVAHKRGISNVSTIVRFLIDPDKVKWNKNYTMKAGTAGSDPFDVPYASIISHITAGIDVDVYYKESGTEEIRVHKNINEIKEGSDDLKEWLKDITYARYRDDASYLNYIESNYQRLRRIEKDGKFYGIAALNTLWNDQSSFFEVLTVGGLSNVGAGSNNSEYIGCLLSDPNTARRDANEGSIDRSEWAVDQLRILYSDTVSDYDRLFLPYIVGKYGIDMTNDMMISILDKDCDKVLMYRFKELLVNMAKHNKKLIIGLSTIIGHDRAENYLDTYRSAQQLEKDEVLFVPVMNSGFLSVKHDDKEYPANLLWCCSKVCEDLGINISKTIEEKKTVSRLGGDGSALVLTFSK